MTALRLHPVIRRTPGQDPSLPAAVRRRNQRRGARDVCHQCANCIGHHLRHMHRDDLGQPAPGDDGWYWAVSHTGSFVGGVIAPFPVGLDVERVRHRSQQFVRISGSRYEYELLGGFRWQAFARLWSAKEALLRKERRELAALERVRLVAAPTERGLVLFHDDRHHFVHQRFSDAHYASVCADLPEDAVLEWDWLDDTPRAGEGRIR